MHAAGPAGRGIAGGQIKWLGSWRASPASFSGGRVGIFEDKWLVSGVVGAAERPGPPPPPAPGGNRRVRASASRPRPNRAGKVCRGGGKSLLKH